MKISPESMKLHRRAQCKGIGHSKPIRSTQQPLMPMHGSGPMLALRIQGGTGFRLFQKVHSQVATGPLPCSVVNSAQESRSGPNTQEVRSPRRRGGVREVIEGFLEVLMIRVFSQAKVDQGFSGKAKG